MDCRRGWWRDSGSESVRIVTRAHHLEQTQFPLEVIRARCGTFLLDFSRHVHLHHPFRIPSSLWIRNEKQAVVFSLKLLILLDLILDQVSEKWSCKALPSLQFYSFSSQILCRSFLFIQAPWGEVLTLGSTRFSPHVLGLVGDTQLSVKKIMIGSRLKN